MCPKETDHTKTELSWNLVQTVALLVCILEVPGWNLGWDTVILIEDFRGFHQVLQANAGAVPQIMPLPPPSTFFPVDH
jgi:hypothetical protein